jgi:hypothetical protein
MTHAPESGATMPVELAAILAEPGWERSPSHRGPDWFQYFGINPDEQRGGHDTLQVYYDADDGWTCGFFSFSCGVGSRSVYAAADLMRRIEAALDADRAGAEEE